MISLQLADQGAEVIKIEDPEKGDPLRAWRVKGHSLHWKVYARNKKSLAINLRPPGVDRHHPGCAVDCHGARSSRAHHRLVGPVPLLKVRPVKPTTIVLVALMAIGGSLTALATTAPVLAQAEAATKTIVLTVENMTCELCPLTVKTAMERVAGVISVVIDFDAKTATVTFDPAAVTIEAVAAASANVGYPAYVAGA
jgi:mercuric ion binding protein